MCLQSFQQEIFQNFSKRLSSGCEKRNGPCISQFFRDIDPIGYIWNFIMRNWLMWLWKPRSPTICYLQTGDQWCYPVPVWRGAKGVNSNPRAGGEEMRCPTSSNSEAGKIFKNANSSFLCLLFCSGLQHVGCCLLTLGRATYLIESTASDAHFYPGTPSQTYQK